MYRLNIDTDELKKQIKNKIQHAYVEKYIESPFIDEHKLVILKEVYDHVDITLNVKKNSIMTVMLIQMALDTHELLPANGSAEMTETEKQLSVLAGDFYSGLYYSLLSDIEQIDLIQVLASAIQQINENKMCLYYEEAATFEAFIQIITEIESLLYTNVAAFYGHNEHTIQLIKVTLLLNRLYREMGSLKKGNHSDFRCFVESHRLNQDSAKLIQSAIEQHELIQEELLVKLPYLQFQFAGTGEKLAYNSCVAKEG